MAVSTLKMSFLTILLLIVVQVTFSTACFGPKLFIGVEPGLEGEMRYHLISIYLHEKTGIDSIRVELKQDQTALAAIAAQEIDLGFASDSVSTAIAVLVLEEGLNLYSGERPINDLQFSTVGRVFKKLQKLLNPSHLSDIRQRVQAGDLPATAVRNFMMKNDWI